MHSRTSAVDRATGDVATYIGLLRAVNLPGHNKIAMADLRDVLTRLGMRDVVTLLQSGNFM